MNGKKGKKSRSTLFTCTEILSESVYSGASLGRQWMWFWPWWPTAAHQVSFKVTKQWRQCVRPCLCALFSFELLFSICNMAIKTRDYWQSCTSLFVLHNAACGLLWICESLMLQKIAHCLAQQLKRVKYKQKQSKKANVWIVVNVVRRLFWRFALWKLAASMCSMCFWLRSVMSLPSRAESCHRLEPMWKSLSGPTCLRARLQPFDTALQPPALWLSHRLLSTPLRKELNGATSALLLQQRAWPPCTRASREQTDGSGRAARCLPLWQTSGEHSAVREDKRDDGEGARANALGC